MGTKKGESQRYEEQGGENFLPVLITDREDSLWL